MKRRALIQDMTVEEKSTHTGYESGLIESKERKQK